jgi:hypothetical protein
VVSIAIFLEDLMGNAGQRPLNCHLVQDYSCRFHTHQQQAKKRPPWISKGAWVFVCSTVVNFMFTFPNLSGLD